MIPLTSGAQHFGYSVFGFPSANAGGIAANQSPFGWGSSLISCSTVNGVSTGFCGSDGSDCSSTCTIVRSPKAM